MFRLNTKRIRLAIAEAGLNAKDLARRAGCAQCTAQQLIKGTKRTLQGRGIAKLAAALNVSVDEILED